MTYTPATYPVILHRTTERTEVVLIQDIHNGAFAESLPDHDLALAVLDVAANLPADSVNHAVLDEAARRLSPDLVADSRPGTHIPVITRLIGWINTVPPLGACALGFCIGGLTTILAVYAFVTQFIQ